MKQLIILLSLLLFIGCESNITVENSDPEIELVAQSNTLEVFGWAKYHFVKGETRLNPKEVNFDLSGSAEFRINDSGISIMPLDTAAVVVEIDNSGTKKSFRLKPSVNSHFDSSWYEVAQGSLPTPLDNKGVRTWSNFSQYRFWKQRIPDFKHFDNLTSDTISEAIFDGKTTLLNFWYLGCSPCMAEMPALKALKDQWETEEDVQFISISLDSVYVRNDSVFVDSKKLKSTVPLADYHIETGFRQIGQGENIAESFWVRGYPTNIIIDQFGIARKILIGANPENDNKTLTENLSNEISRIRQNAELNLESPKATVRLGDQ
jgi:thiol-disulfide isomerase/thioredoxin